MGGHAAENGFLRVMAGGIVLRVRLTPRSSSDDIVGVVATGEGPALSIRVRAVPSDGEANAAVCQVLARWLGLAKSCVALTGGHKSRIKTMTVTGDGLELMDRVQNCLALADPAPLQNASPRKRKKILGGSA